MGNEKQLVAVKTLNKVNAVRVHFETDFTNIFGAAPVLTHDDLDILEVCLAKFGEDRLKKLLTHYLTMNDDWFRKRGFTLDVFKTNLNKIITDAGSAKSNRVRYFVGWTEHGQPCCDYHPEIPDNMPRSAKEFERLYNFEPDPVPKGWVMALETRG